MVDRNRLKVELNRKGVVIKPVALDKYCCLLEAYYRGVHVDVGWNGLISCVMQTEYGLLPRTAYALACLRSDPDIKNLFSNE